MNATASLDARGKSCPLPIVLTAKALRELNAGEVLLVRANDLAFVSDIEAWCKKTGHELLGIVSESGFLEARIRKAA